MSCGTAEGGGPQENLSLLVDPVELRGLVADDLTLLEPESNLLLGVLNRVGTVADVAADIDGEVTTDGARGGGQGVGGAEEDCGEIILSAVWRRRV